MKHEARTKSGR